MPLAWAAQAGRMRDFALSKETRKGDVQGVIFLNRPRQFARGRNLLGTEDEEENDNQNAINRMNSFGH